MNEAPLDVDTLRSRYAETVALLEQLTKKYEALLHENELLKRQTYGQKAEKVRHEEAQLPLLELLAAIGRLKDGDESAAVDAQKALDAAQNALADQTKQKNKGAPHGRRKLALEDLPVRRVVIDPPERSAPGGERLIKIGEEVTRLLEHVPGSLVVIEVVRTKFKAPDDGKAPIVVAEMPERVVPKAMAEPGLLARILVSKFADHIPLHRQEGIFKREGCKLARSTLGEWVDASTSLLGHVFDAMWKDARENATYWIVDATGVLVQDKDQCKRAHFYVVVVPKEHVLFRFTRSNDGPAVANLLADFKGYVHADAATVYHELYRQEQLTEVGCWAHARRYFFEALSRDRERALIGIGFISHLYDAHRASLLPDGVADTEKRATVARPLLEDIFEWASGELKIVEENTPIHQALGYLVRQREPLSRFLADGRLRLDTNPAELALRQEVVGRKNWLFVGSDDGAKWNTISVSLIASCQMHGIEPWSYLRDVLTLLPSWPKHRALELAPKHWADTLAKSETQELLAELRLIDRARPVEPIDAVLATDA